MKKVTSTSAVAVGLPSCIAMLFLLGSPSAQSSDASPEWFEQTADNAWLQPYDTTLLSRRASWGFSYENHDGDAEFWKIENTLRGGFSITEDLAFGLQLMIPVKWIDTAASDASGVGDLEFRTGFICRLSPTMRWAAGFNAAFDTANDSALGGNALVLRPILALRWDASERINMGVNVEYSYTPREEQTDDVSAFELTFPVVFKIDEDWSVALSYKPLWDFLNETDRHRMELGATRLLGPVDELALSFAIEVPLTSESLEYRLASGLTWHF